MWLTIVVTWFVSTGIVDCTEIRVPVGGAISFELPGYDDCGQFSLLDPYLTPVIIIEGRRHPNILPQYEDRLSFSIIDTGYNLTIGGATEEDGGLYQLTSPSREGLKCQGVTYRVVVQNENFGPWSSWSSCVIECDPNYTQTRTRSCSNSNGCEGQGDTAQNQTCDLAFHCPRWTEWGNWSDCSAKCGKGFKIRKRVCVNGDSALLKSTDCSGPQSQSHMCMTVCDVLSYWDDWSDWGNCTSDCGGGMRNRTRTCVTDSRVTKTGCEGDSEQTESCNEHSCSNTDVTSTGGPTAEDEPLNIAVVVVVLCLATIILILIPVMLLRKRCTEKKSVDAITVVKRPEGGRRKPKTSTASNGSQQPDQSIGTNLYSELSSSFVYPASEFDSVFDDPPSAGMSVHIPQLENINEVHGEEEQETYQNQHEVIDEEDEFDHESKNENADTDDNIVNDSNNNDATCDVVYFQPPDEDTEHIENDDEKTVNELDIDSVSDHASVYYEPPESPHTNSKKIRNISVKSNALNVVEEKVRKESVYENISNVQRPDRNSADIESVDEKRKVSFNQNINDQNVFHTEDTVEIQNEGNHQIALQKEREAMEDKHIYVNDSTSPVIEFSEPIDSESEDHIYDVPKFKE